MKLPLTISPGYPCGIHISDASGRVVCTMPGDAMALALRIVRRENGWRYRLFGAWMDARQRRYNQWVYRRNAQAP